MNAILLGVLSGSMAIAYLGLVIANPQVPEQVKSLQASLLNEMLKNLKPVTENEQNDINQAGAPNVAAAPVSEAAAADCSLGSAYADSVRRWCGPIQNYATEHQIDPNLIAAVMQQESGGDPNAYSSSGAVGLLQVMPSDGIAASFYCAAGPCFASRPTTQELLNPEFNISYGAGMLAGLINRYQDVREALRAYGPLDVGYSYADTVLAIYGGY
ncbi:MAG: transglycosylase SLT domain-containing protein [Anaerolineae bacterium]|nr:transglycosylase SLT domain-containing protein [Anaerolineae bacterium]